MASEPKQDLLKQIPPITELLKGPEVLGWLKTHPPSLVTDCLRGATASARAEILADSAGRCGTERVTPEAILARAATLLTQATAPHLRAAINATGIILHTGLGRAVFPSGVVDSMLPELKGYSTLAVDRESGERIERERNGKSLQHGERAVRAPKHHAIEFAAVEREAEHRRQFFRPAEFEFEIRFHCVSFATKFSRAFSPSAQPSRLKSCRYKIFGEPSLTSKINFTRR